MTPDFPRISILAAQEKIHQFYNTPQPSTPPESPSYFSDDAADQNWDEHTTHGHIQSSHIVNLRLGPHTQVGSTELGIHAEGDQVQRWNAGFGNSPYSKEGEAKALINAKEALINAEEGLPPYQQCTLKATVKVGHISIIENEVGHLSFTQTVPVSYKPPCSPFCTKHTFHLWN